MAELVPQVDYASLSDYDIAEIGLDAARAAFDCDVKAGLTNGDSLDIIVGTVNSLGEWLELGRRTFGPDGEQFFVNIEPDDGKLATVLTYNVDSILAYRRLGDKLPEGPQRWTGGVTHNAYAHTREGWRSRTFCGAASGVQGHFDMATVYTALTRMGAAWALQMQ